MFTGIIAEQGKVLSVERNGDSSATVRLHAPGTTDGLALGGSIAVNGVCLTATQIDGRDFSVDVMGETLVRSTIGELTAGDPVNLERVRGLATGTGCGSRCRPGWPGTSPKRDPSPSTASPSPSRQSARPTIRRPGLK